MKKIPYILIISFLSISCEKVFLGEDEVNTPINNFEIFWKDFDQHYALFHVRGWDWDSIYQVYRPKVNEQTSDGELWDIFRDMIAYLDDSHTSIASPPPSSRFFISGSEEDSIVEKEFSIDIIKNKYIQNYEDIPSVVAEENIALFGNVKNKDIGYIYLEGIETIDEGFMDDVLSKIGHHKAIILDIRNNLGGEDKFAKAIAGRFAQEKKLVYTVQERNGPLHTDFGEKTYYYSTKSGKEYFAKPVVVLTDRITVSAAEVLLLYLKSFSQVTQIGDSTAGDFSDIGMVRFLPNGWQYEYSIMMFLLPDGSSLDGIGHAPDVQIRNSVSDIQAGNDLVFEKAVKYLFDEYGIE